MASLGAAPADLGRVLETEARLLAQRLRSYPGRALVAPAGPFPSRAAAARHLAQRLADLGAAAEEAAPGSRRVPDLPAYALGDAVLVTAHDLADVTHRRRPDATLRLDGAVVPVGRVVAMAVAEVLLHRWHVDRAAPGRRTAATVLAVLDPDGPGGPERLLEVAAALCRVGAAS